MDKLTKLSLLLDFYGKLLTPKQFEIFDLHYNNDYSLSEISENLGITRQGVHDSLKRAENSLYEYEEKLQLVNKFITQNEQLKEILGDLKILDNSYKYMAEKSKISDIIFKLENLITFNE